MILVRHIAKLLSVRKVFLRANLLLTIISLLSRLTYTNAGIEICTRSTREQCNAIDTAFNSILKYHCQFIIIYHCQCQFSTYLNMSLHTGLALNVWTWVYLQVMAWNLEHELTYSYGLNVGTWASSNGFEHEFTYNNSWV